MIRIRHVAFRRLILLGVILWSHPAFAQVDLMGSWRPLPRNQDGSGMTGDIAGVPVTDAARWRVAELVAGRLRRHRVGVPSARLGLLARRPALRAARWADIDQATQKVIAYRGHLNMLEQETTIWMDGRPHPPANASTRGAVSPPANGTATRWS